MPDKHKNNSPCFFAEQLVSYLYGEIDAREKTVFETHLKLCSSCADELADFGFVRASVLDWKKTEFSAMQTPQFVLPSERENVLPETVSVSAARKTRISELRRIFSISPAWTAASALAALAIFVGLIAVVINFSRNDETAGNDSENTQTAKVSPAFEKKVEETREIIGEKNVGEIQSNKPLKSNALKAENSPHGINRTAVNTLVSNDSTTKISSVSRGKKVINKSSPNTNYYAVAAKKQDNAANKINPSVQSRKMPKFVDVEEDEDDSLRLADLLEEVGSR